MGKSKKQEPKVAPLLSWGEVDDCLAVMCRTENRIDAGIAQMNRELAEVRARHEPELTAMAETFEAMKASVRAFAAEHPEDFRDPRTVERVHGILSFQKSPPSVAPLSKKWTWKKIVELAERVLPQFIRRPPELDKMALLTAWKDRQVTDEQLAQAGMCVRQDDVFHLDLKRDAPPATPASAIAERQGADSCAGRKAC